MRVRDDNIIMCGSWISCVEIMAKNVCVGGGGLHTNVCVCVVH